MSAVSRWGVACAAACLLWSGIQATAAVTRRVRATGLAAVSGGDVADAFERARRAALREAVEEGVGVLVSSATRVRNFELIDEHILSATRGYVSAYDIVARGIEEGAYRVVVDAVVDLGVLHRDLDALDLTVAASGDPRVLCLAQEWQDDRLLDWNVLAGSLYEALSELSDLRVTLAEPGFADTGQAELREHADVLVRGRGQLSGTDAAVPFSGRRLSQTGLYSVTASVQVAARWVDEPRPLAVLNAQGRGAGPSEREAGERALRHGVSRLAGDLRHALVEDLRARAFSGRTVQVIVEGTSLGSRLDELTRSLAAGLGSVESLRVRSVTGGRARFDVRTPLAAFDLARRLSARGLEATDVEILEVTANTLRLALRQPAGAVE